MNRPSSWSVIVLLIAGVVVAAAAFDMHGPELGLIVVIAVAAAAAKGGIGTGMLSAAFAVVGTFAAAAISAEAMSPHVAVTTIAFTICYVAVAYLTGCVRERLNQARGVHMLMRSELIHEESSLERSTEHLTGLLNAVSQAKWR